MPNSFKSSLTTYGIVAGSSLFFCSKAVFVKLSYRYGVDPITVLALRMAFALPFFLFGGWLDSKQQKTPLTLRDWGLLAVLGFFGWYLSSMVNFAGLQYVSVGLERMILYTYPSIVVLGSVLFFGKPLRWGVVLAMIISYLGIIIGYHAEATSNSDKALLGASLIFASAVSYAIFVLLSGQTVSRIGPVRFTSCVVGFSCLYILIHYFATHPVEMIFSQRKEAYLCGIVLAIAGTVIPSYLFSIGLKRSGSQAFAIIGMIGPLGTVFLAWMILGEALNPTQIIGLLLTLAGGLMVSLMKGK